MATYVIGDIQGCYHALLRLLDRVGYDERDDRVWLVGDLVNRGPDSLGVLRWAAGRAGVTAVLGNHDLHLLAVAAGTRKLKSKDTLSAVLEAPDARELVAWLAERPLIHREGDAVMVHAGLLPQWSVGLAEQEARHAESMLQTHRRDVLAGLYDEAHLHWSAHLSGVPRAKATLRAMATLRVCTEEGRLHPSFNLPPEQTPEGYYPWFDVPGRASTGATLLFGHWAALDLHVEDRVIGLDTGCVWGRRLTAFRLDDRQLFHEPAGDNP